MKDSLVALSTLAAFTSLNLAHCGRETDEEVVVTLSSLAALTAAAISHFAFI